MRKRILKAALMGSAGAACMANLVFASSFNIPAGDMDHALQTYMAQSGVQLFVSDDVVKGLHTGGIKGDLSADDALSRLLSGTGLTTHRDKGAVAIIHGSHSSDASDVQLPLMQLAQAAPARGAVETVTVTSSKLGGADVQSIPIAITALSQEQLTSTQTAGGPDLVKQVPNLTFTKTNFTGYSIQIRGIGTQAISVATDPAVAVALNDIPFIRNHFFEQEFFDLGQAEVLRGPQGTLYGRNATAGVVNLITAKSTDQFEASASADVGNYKNRRFEGMINLPIVDDRLDLRIAGEWTKRNGYTTNALTGDSVDGRDLWSSRVTLGWKPVKNLQAYLVWEHFYENDDRMRSSKQLCKTDPVPAEVGGVPIPLGNSSAEGLGYGPLHFLTQGCRAGSLYSDDAFGVPNGESLPYFIPLGAKTTGGLMSGYGDFDPYASTTQSHNLRVIETQLDPVYKAKNDTLELNVDYSVTPALTLTSQTGYNQDFLWSTEDYNRFNTRPGAFSTTSSQPNLVTPDPSGNGLGVCTDSGTSGGCNGVGPGDICTVGIDGNNCHAYGIFCDPQLGCSNRLVAQDLNEEHAWQLSQEFRFASNFSGPFNFSAGGNYLHYETEENYYVFINSLTLASYAWGKGTGGSPYQTLPWVPGVSDNSNCLADGIGPLVDLSVPTQIGAGGGNMGVPGSWECMYIDPNPLTKLNNQGHNYFLSQNPYALNSYAGFGEAYYNLTNELKLTGGLRWTDDRKHFTDIPSELLVRGYGYPVSGVVNQEWQKFTGRALVNWTPKLDFTDQTLVYGSYSRGYKAGGANPPGATLLTFENGDIANPIHPLTFKPEYINAYELGTKNTLYDGGLTFNGDIFYYDYKGYQISRIVDRTAINDNFDATVKGAEIEATYEPIPGLKFHFAGGYEDTRIADGQSSIDLIDRTDSANHPDWVVVKPFPTQASNCVLPAYVIAALLQGRGTADPNSVAGACAIAYSLQLDPLTGFTYVPDPTVMVNYAIGGTLPVNPVGYPGFNPLAAPNGGQGFAKELGGNELPNAPRFTTSFSAEYSAPITSDWAATLHGDFYWQAASWARVFNDDPYDRLHGYTNVNLALILTNQSGWQVMGYLKNVFNTAAITGTFLNSDDSGLTTNVFLTDPRLFGVRVTKNW